MHTPFLLSLYFFLVIPPVGFYFYILKKEKNKEKNLSNLSLFAFYCPGVFHSSSSPLNNNSLHEDVDVCI